MFNLPNALTCANLFSGCIGIVLCFNGELKTAAYFVILSGIFDFFDGMAARALKINNKIGKDLDSLADVISFGFLPGVIMYHLFKQSDASHYSYLPYLGFVITIFSALRLAKFNTDERQTVDFIGLNTPMNTLFICSLPFVANLYPSIIANPIVLSAIVIVTSFLLISEIKIFSLKFKSLKFSENKIKFSFVIMALMLFAWHQFVAIPLILLLYILLSFIYFKQDKSN